MTKMKTRVCRLALLLAGLASARGDGRHVANVESLVAQPAEDAADGSVGEVLPAVAAERKPKRRDHYTPTGVAGAPVATAAANFVNDSRHRRQSTSQGAVPSFLMRFRFRIPLKSFALCPWIPFLF